MTVAVTLADGNKYVTMMCCSDDVILGIGIGIGYWYRWRPIVLGIGYASWYRSNPTEKRLRMPPKRECLRVEVL